MVYFANFADNNFCLRGCNAGSIDPNNTEGMFNSAFVACFSWPNWTTSTINAGCSSWSQYIRQCCSPFVNTTQAGMSNNQITSYIRYQARPFSLNLHGAGSNGITTVQFTSPISKSSTGTLFGYNCVALSSRQNFVTITCTLDYNYIFSSWHIGTVTSGEIATFNQTQNLFFNSNYGISSTNFLNIGAFCANAFTF